MRRQRWLPAHLPIINSLAFEGSITSVRTDHDPEGSLFPFPTKAPILRAPQLGLLCSSLTDEGWGRSSLRLGPSGPTRFARPRRREEGGGEEMQPTGPTLLADQFDRIPDALVLVIFNKLADVLSLGRCASVSKRFNALVPFVHEVSVKIDRAVTVDEDVGLTSPKPRNLFSQFLKVVLSNILRPFGRLCISSPGKSPPVPQGHQHSPAQVLRRFTHVQNLRIELPAGDVGTEDGVVLKWRAEFGSTLHNCVILGGTQTHRRPVPAIPDRDAQASPEDDGSIPESFYADGGLKLRVVWTISTLIAASSRHYLLHPIIKDHPSLRSLELTDADGQGTLSMGLEQLREFGEQPLASSAAESRTQVPASNMRLSYAPYLDLPEGIAMQGATLMAIKPSVDGGLGRKEDVGKASGSGAFGGPFDSAVKALSKRRTYLLEMNGF